MLNPEWNDDESTDDEAIYTIQNIEITVDSIEGFRGIMECLRCSLKM